MNYKTKVMLPTITLVKHGKTIRIPLAVLEKYILWGNDITIEGVLFTMQELTNAHNKLVGISYGLH